jgi:hypothetical protein
MTPAARFIARLRDNPPEPGKPAPPRSATEREAIRNVHRCRAQSISQS